MRILALIAKRLVWFVPTAAGLIAVVFFISRVIPSDPVALLAGETASREAIEALRTKLGLDRPLLVQLLDYYRQLLRGDLGTSLFTTRPVSEDLLARLPATIELTLAAMLIAVADRHSARRHLRDEAQLAARSWSAHSHRRRPCDCQLLAGARPAADLRHEARLLPCRTHHRLSAAGVTGFMTIDALRRALGPARQRASRT
jgi:hypothetical protein